MNVIKLNKNYLEAFMAYCQKHRYEHDESYLYEEDMEEFEIGDKFPTYLLIENETIIGVLSLMLDEYFVKGHKSRIRIFHCEKEDLAHYQLLFDAMEPLDREINIIESFMPNKKDRIQSYLKTLGFKYYRTAYVMVRKDQEPVQVSFPAGYILKPFVHGTDEGNYAHVRNIAFKSLKGSETPITEEMVAKLTTESYILKNGTQILWYDGKPVGVLNMMEEEDASGKYSFVAPIALLPEHQGKGLGTQLLKAGIAIGHEQGYPDCMLSVNAENEQALGLYTKVGFVVDEAIGCFQYTIRD